MIFPKTYRIGIAILWLYGKSEERYFKFKIKVSKKR